MIPEYEPHQCYDKGSGSDDGGDSAVELEQLCREEVGYTNYRHEQCGNKGDDIGFLLLHQIDGNGPKHEDRERLIAPSKPAPDGLETVSVADLPDKQGNDGSKERHTDIEALADGTLLQVDEVGNDKAT